MATKRNSTTTKKTSATAVEALHNNADKALVTTYIMLGLIIVLVATQFALAGVRQQRALDHTTIQAVTLTTGQTFFGVLEPVGSGTYAIHNAHYIQQQPAQDNSIVSTEDGMLDTTAESAIEETTAVDASASTNLQLVKVSDDLHMPADPLYVRKDQVIYWQNLEQNSPIIQTMLSE